MAKRKPSYIAFRQKLLTPVPFAVDELPAEEPPAEATLTYRTEGRYNVSWPGRDSARKWHP
jgi:hypothetical protein